MSYPTSKFVHGIVTFLSQCRAKKVQRLVNMISASAESVRCPLLPCCDVLIQDLGSLPAFCNLCRVLSVPSGPNVASTNSL
jgi:hypothetical protein